MIDKRQDINLAAAEINKDKFVEYAKHGYGLNYFKAVVQGWVDNNQFVNDPTDAEIKAEYNKTVPKADQPATEKALPGEDEPKTKKKGGN